MFFILNRNIKFTLYISTEHSYQTVDFKGHILQGITRVKMSFFKEFHIVGHDVYNLTDVLCCVRRKCIPSTANYKSIKYETYRRCLYHYGICFHLQRQNNPIFFALIKTLLSDL